ncbi:MAG: TIGR04282 family arsenosugar biosynthesis glycosyltransferase [Nitrospirae bacterium]|nr:TIGR04282 family arsenosugar biosynthesis glycosyltransferase [Nitrospirota bacterium]
MVKDGAIVVFARAPEPSKVKTRLKDALTEGQRVSLYVRLMEKAIDAAQGIDGADAYIAFTPDDAAGYFHRYRLPAFPQRGADIGERMDNALQHLFSLGYGKAVLIGCDIPHISTEILAGAFRELDVAGGTTNGLKVVFGPTFDGGYYLVGLRRGDSGSASMLFRGIPWSTGEVLNMTLQKAREKGYEVTLLETLRDVDTPEDLDGLGEWILSI